MSKSGPLNRLAGGTSGRIIDLLRQGPMTIDDLAQALNLTRTAVRAQLTVLMSRGIVEPRGSRKGPSKPARMFAVTGQAEQQLSRAYVPVLTELLQQLSRRMTPEELDHLLAEVGRNLGPHHPAKGSLQERIERANQLLLDLGGLTSISEEGRCFVILGQGCPLAAATAQFPQACTIISSLLTEAIGQPVTSCCEEHERKRCCFEVAEGAA